jgi:hypothetical protein
MKQSFTDSINTTFLMSALIGAAAVGVAFLMKGKRRKNQETAPAASPEIVPSA